MRFTDVLATALAQLRANKLRSFFTLLGIIVSVAFLVAVVAIIQGMNGYVRDNVAGAIIGANSFQVRRSPITLGIFDDEEMRRIARRPRVTPSDAEVVRDALPDAVTVALTSGWPTPLADVKHRDRIVGDAVVFGITPGYQVVQDYRFARGEPITDVDVRERRPVAVIGTEIADKLFENVDPIGKPIRLNGWQLTVGGVIAPKGRVLGQSFDGFVLVPYPVHEMIFGRRKTATISVKMADAEAIPGAMRRAEEAMRLAHRLRPGEENDFSIETSDALVSFWQTLTRVLFAVVPAVVAIGILVGGIVIMNIMLMSVRERMHEIGLRKSVGATRADIRRQFLAEAVLLAILGGALGLLAGWAFASLVAAVSPLPATVTWWSAVLALTLGAGVGVLFGVYPATRAARLDPITALRAE